MYKVLGSILLFIFLLMGSAFLLLFTSNGNSLLKPYINSYISKNYKGLDLRISSFTLRPNFLDIEAYLFGDIRVVINGDIDIYKRKLNLDFMINAKDISNKFVNMDGTVDLKGKIGGKLKYLKVYGDGKVFDSVVKFDTVIVDYDINNFHLKMDKAKIAKILNLANKPPYVAGIANIEINLDELKPKNLKGYANIDIPYGSVNTMLVKKELNVTMPPSFIFSLKTKTTLSGENTISKVIFNSNIFKLNSSKLLYNIKDRSLDGDFTIIVPHLNLLNSITHQNLRGDFRADGKIKKIGEDISYVVSTNSFGGDMQLKGDMSKLDIVAKSLKMEKILYKIGLPRYTYANIDMKVSANSIQSKNISADIKATIDNGIFNKKVFQKDFNITIPKELKYRARYIANIKEGHLKADIDINSSIATIFLNNIDTYLKTLKTIGSYDVNIPDLSKMDFAIKRKLYTNLKTSGDFTYFDDIFLVNGNANTFKTNIKYSYKNADINLNIKNLDTRHLLSSLGYPAIFEAKGSATVFYNPKWKKGNFKVILNNGKIVKNELSDTVYMLSGFDMTKELYKSSLLQGTVQGDLVKFVYDMNSTNTVLKMYDAKVDIKRESISAPFLIKIRDKDILGEIKGSLRDPKVEIKTSSYIKNKIEKAIDKKVPKKFQEPLKQILNLFGG